MFTSNSWKQLPKWQYCVAYDSKQNFKIFTNKARIPDHIVGKTHSWSRYNTIVEALRRTNHIVDEVPKYVKMAERFVRKGLVKQLDSKILASIPYWNKLYQHQKDAVAYSIIDYKGKVYLADEMGVGKTLTAVCLSHYLLLTHGNPRILILCPASLQKNWKQNFEERNIHNVDIYSYDKAKNDFKEIKQKKYGIIIADEAHCVKDTKTKRYKRLAPIMKKIPFKILISGTPTVNRCDELYAPLSILHPKIFNRKKKFIDRYYNKLSRKCRIPNEIALILPLFGFIRRTKTEVLTLPPKQINVINVKDKKASVKFKIMLTKMQDPENMENPNMLKYLIGEAFHELGNVKSESTSFIEAVTVMLDDCIEKTTSKVVFCIHRSVVACLRTLCENLGKSFEVINGETVVKKRAGIVSEFQKGNIDILICSINAAGVGLTMTKSNHVIMAESSWVPGLNQQAIDRCHRIGQTKTVFVDRIFMHNSIDDFIVKCESGKKKMHKLLLKHLKDNKKKNTIHNYF